MSDYISREAVMDVFMRYGIGWGNAKVKGVINSIPAADVREVVKANFKLVDGYSITALGYDIKGLECSNCGATFIAQSWVQRFKFCPNCGADMRGKS